MLPIYLPPLLARFNFQSILHSLGRSKILCKIWIAAQRNEPNCLNASILGNIKHSEKKNNTHTYTRCWWFICNVCKPFHFYYSNTTAYDAFLWTGKTPMRTMELSSNALSPLYCVNILRSGIRLQKNPSPILLANILQHPCTEVPIYNAKLMRELVACEWMMSSCACK